MLPGGKQHKTKKEGHCLIVFAFSVPYLIIRTDYQVIF